MSRVNTTFATSTKAKLSPATLREGVLTGRRYGSADAVGAGLADAECPAAALAGRAAALAGEGLPARLGVAAFDAANFRRMKIELYTDAYRALSTGAFDAAPESRL